MPQGGRLSGAGMGLLFRLAHARAHASSTPPTAPSTVFFGETGVSCVRPKARPMRYAPVSAAMMASMVVMVATRPTVMCVGPPSCVRERRAGSSGDIERDRTGARRAGRVTTRLPDRKGKKSVCGVFSPTRKGA